MMNILKSFGLMPHLLSNCAVVYAPVQQVRILPYAAVFDLLHHFNDDILNEDIAAIFDTALFKSSDYKNNIDLWVDLESLGEISNILAKKLAAAISEYLNDSSCLKITYVVAEKKQLTRENNLFIEYLAAMNKKFSVFYSARFRVTYNPINDKNYLKWPTLAGDADLNSAATIINYAWRCAELGAEQIGFRILNDAIDGTDDAYLSTLYLVQLQYMRVAAQHYQLAAEEERAISEKYPDLLQAFYLTKAWASILEKSIEAARHYFQLAGVTIDYMPSDLDSLYRLNIFALLQHLSGHTPNAFKIENRIKAAIAALNEQRPQITYINAINLARLYRHNGDFEQALQHYNQAFATTIGTKSETDFVYSNVCYGMLYEKMGELNRALKFWLKASLHWLITETPEALGWRAIRAIAKPDFKPRAELDPNLITKAFINKLTSLLALNKINISIGSKQNITISVYKDQQFSEQSCIHGIEGISVITNKNEYRAVKNKVLRNKLSNELMTLVYEILCYYLPSISEKSNTIIIDRSDGTEVPQDLSNILRSALLLNIRHIVFNNKKIAINEKLREKIWDHLVIKPSPAILEFNTNDREYPYIRHKRYFYRKQISMVEAELLQLLQLENNFREIQKHIFIDNEELLNLAQRGLIEFINNFTLFEKGGREHSERGDFL